MKSTATVLGKRLYWPNLRDAAVLENVQSRFNFPYICLYFFPPTCRQTYGKLKRDWRLSSAATSLKFGEYTLLLSIFILRFIYSEFLFKESYLPSDSHTNTEILADMSIYPECSAWGHSFAYRGMFIKFCLFIFNFRSSKPHLYAFFHPDEWEAA